MDEKEVNDAVDFLRKHTAMTEQEALFRSVRVIAICVLILLSVLFLTIGGCVTLEKKFAFENGYEEGSIAGSSGSHWIKSSDKPKTPEVKPFPVQGFADTEKKK